MNDKKIELPIFFCPICTKLIDSIDDGIRYEYEALCELYCMFGQVLVNGAQSGRLMPIHQMLEKNGIIVSTEVDQILLAIQPQGYEFIDTFHYFCPFKGRHL